jgi:hypothetical protein
MHIKTIVSAVALSAALGFGGAVYAQDAAATALPTMIAEQTLNEADAQRVKVYCDDLQTRENQAVGTNDDEQELTDTDSDSATDDTASATDDGDDDSATVGSIDMASITLANCQEAGFLTTP